MAVEDAAVIGNLFSRLTSKAQIPAILKAYETVRLPRTSCTQASSRQNQHIFHLDDGPDQEARDKVMREVMSGAISTEGNLNQWADEKKNLLQFSYDADCEVDSFWAKHGAEIERLGDVGKDVGAKL
jgi:salicylate hydroxylase